ncbi:MAG: hypothetical protein RRC34_16345 [Lentisphaeria bacterium]|nr:hypothetical protein [Lentisphaeria bacterium]
MSEEILDMGLSKLENIDYIAAWGNTYPEDNCVLEEIDYFNARGMRRIYTRSDCFGRYHSFNMDIWRRSDGELLLRLWSRCTEIDWRAFKIKGIDLAIVPCHEGREFFEDEWIPLAVRQAYDNWITEEW